MVFQAFATYPSFLSPFIQKSASAKRIFLVIPSYLLVFLLLLIIIFSLFLLFSEMIFLDFFMI